MDQSEIDDLAPHVYRFAVYMLRDHHAAEDVTQETLLRAWKHRRKLAAAKHWMLRVASNLCRDYLRRHQTKFHQTVPITGDPSGNAPEPWFGLLQKEHCLTLEQTVKSLSPRESRVLYLSAFEGFDNSEIADVLGLSEGAVKVALYRARKAVRSVLLKQQQNES